jgi:predicted DNA binding protein
MYGLESFDLVERRPRSRDYILLLRQRNPPWLRRVLSLAGRQISPTAPFRLNEEKSIATFHGEDRSLQRVLRRLDREEIPYRVLRASSHPVVSDSAEAPLTERQRGAIASAWALGYYAVPRRITLSRLARVTGRSPPALGKMLRRAEGHLVVRFLAGNPGAPSTPESR